MIEILNIRKLNKSGSIKGFVDFTLAGKMEVHGAKIIQQAGQRAWVAMPDRSYEVDGERKYAPIVKILDQGLKEKIEAAILAAFDAYETPVSSFDDIESDEIERPGGKAAPPWLEMP